MSPLAETFNVVLPAIVAFASRLAKTAPGEKPILPEILGTGFVVDERGIVVTNRHVVDAFLSLPRHPRTGSSSVVALLTPGVQEAPSGHTMPIIMADIKGGVTLTSFSSDTVFYGEPVPDLAFVQLNVKEIPHLSLATEAGSWTVGTDVAIAGFPLGTEPLALFKKVTQLMPSLKHGIISSVQPFPCPFPHGFLTDILTQGGNSGSPVFLAHRPVVVGIHKGVVIGGDNMTIAIPSHLIAKALEQFLSENLMDVSAVPSMRELLTQQPWEGNLSWETLGIG